MSGEVPTAKVREREAGGRHGSVVHLGETLACAEVGSGGTGKSRRVGGGLGEVGHRGDGGLFVSDSIFGASTTRPSRVP